MTNQDTLKQSKLEIQTRISKALKEDNAEDFAKALDDLGALYSDTVRKEFEEYKRSNDSAILEKAGIKQYTSAELKSFEKIIDTQKAGAAGIDIPTAAIEDTFVTRLINDIKQESPLLSAVNITESGYLTSILLDDSENQPATWTGMGEDISEAEFGTKVLSLVDYKLGKIIFIPNEIIDMGPAWVASFVERKLKDVFRIGLETSVVTGSGAKGPLGMTRTRVKGTDSQGTYSYKDQIAVNSFSTVEYCDLVARLVNNEKGEARTFDKVVLIAHPITIITKIIPATKVRTSDGNYSGMIFPFDTVVIPTVALDPDEAVLGINNKYEVFIGKGTSKDGSINEDKSIGFKNHTTAFKIYMYGNGAFVDENDFIYLDLENFTPATQQVEIVNTVNNPVNTKEAATAEG